MCGVQNQNFFTVTLVVFVDLQITLTQSLKMTFFFVVKSTVLSVVCDYVTWNENSNDDIENIWEEPIATKWRYHSAFD